MGIVAAVGAAAAMGAAAIGIVAGGNAVPGAVVALSAAVILYDEVRRAGIFGAALLRPFRGLRGFRRFRGLRSLRREIHSVTCFSVVVPIIHFAHSRIFLVNCAIFLD